jgi:hypothetical protein
METGKGGGVERREERRKKKERKKEKKERKKSKKRRKGGRKERRKEGRKGRNLFRLVDEHVLEFDLKKAMEYFQKER